MLTIVEKFCNYGLLALKFDYSVESATIESKIFMLPDLLKSFTKACIELFFEKI